MHADGFIESYVCWREACEDVRTTYRRWRKGEALQRGSAFDSYCAALDREEHAARIHSAWDGAGARARALTMLAIIGHFGVPTLRP
jgi:hypothetical protein